VEKYWKELNLVEVVTKEKLEKIEKSDLKDLDNKDLESFQALIRGTDASEWKKQGLKMFKNKYYEQAHKCFEKSGDEDLKRRCEGYIP